MTDAYMLVHRHHFESGGVDEKLLGIYTDELAGLQAISRFVILPGFCDHPQGFELTPEEIGSFYWDEGFEHSVEQTSAELATHIDGASGDLSSAVYVVYPEYEFPPEIDNTRFVGLSASGEDAARVITHLKTKPGFREHAGGFTVDRYLLNQDHWDEGYFTAEPDEFSCSLPRNNIVNPGAFEESEEGKRWKRIATRVQAAFAVVKRNEASILIKFDGARENGEIFTVVNWPTKDVDAFSRTDSSDLEGALTRVLEAGIADMTLPEQDFAGPLREFELLARRGYIVCVRMLPNADGVDFEVILIRDGPKSPSVRRLGPVLSEIAPYIIAEAERAF